MEEHPKTTCAAIDPIAYGPEPIMKIQGLTWVPRLTVKNSMILVALFAMMMGAFAYVRRAIESKVIVLNRSGQDIAWIRVEVCDQSYDFKGIPDGGKASATFRATHDSEYRVTGRLEDGTELPGDGYGYVTNSEFGLRTTFIIESGGKVVFLDDWTRR
jgi:hypothetical protein